MDTENKSRENEALKLRAHHICCIPFWSIEFKARGPGFLRVQKEIKEALRSQPDACITVGEGVDRLCQQCPLRIDQRCNSPFGNEDEVRKWDAALLKELGLPFGTCLTAREWQERIKAKVPFKLCQKCQWKHVCSTGAIYVNR